jgi:hypothetical protein
MDDKLEKFIKSHRAEMDDKNPKRDLWAGIESEISQHPRQRNISKSVVYWRAAAVILLLITSWLVIDKVYQNSDGNGTTEVAAINPQLLDAENFYISLIDQKREEVKIMSEKYDFGGEFLSEIQLLDSMYTLLKKDMNNGNEEVLVDAMILNLQLRIEILNQQLSIIQSIENSQKDEKINI